MKVLLVGEYSGFHNNLKSGLESLGHQAILAASGDGFKQLPVDIQLGSTFKGYLGKVHRVWRSLTFLYSAKKFDVVQLVNPDIFPAALGLNRFIIRKLIKRNRKVVLVACGDDYAYIKHGISKMRYSPIRDSLEYDLKIKKHPLDSPRAELWWKELVEEVDAIIPVMHEYKLGYEGIQKLKPCIPLPIDVDKISFSEMCDNQVITVLHGDNRYGFKGTRYVESAFEILRDKYRDKVELIIAGKLPLEKYLEIMRRSHIIVDQVNSYSCGMNALYAMAMGKVVIGGAEPESLYSLEIPDSPVINVTPSASSIVDAIEPLLENKKLIVELGLKSRIFVEKYHCSRNIADRYLKAWSDL